MEIVSAVVIIGVIGLIFGCLLEYASVIFHVEKDPRIDEITECLPGANCGGCGYAGCSAYARAVVEENADVAKCSVGGAAVAEKIAGIMGVKAEIGAKKAARLLCGGDCEKATDKYTYFGVSDCRAASKLAGGAKSCAYGCLGLGTCKSVCQFGAISIENGIAKIDSEKCTACGMCVNACPKNLIELIEENKPVSVRCKNKDKGPMANKVCKASCIGCRICEKNCPNGAISVTDNLAVIDYSKCTGCGICSEKCPKKAIG